MRLKRAALLKALLLRYPFRDEDGIHFRARILDLCADFVACGLADANTVQKLCSQDDAIYWQQFSEVLLAHQLWKAEVSLRRFSEGPDGLPHEAILLRWTAAIKEKAEKLLGNKETSGYLKKGIVGAADAYVIAVNGYLLRHPCWPAQLLSASQFPFAVEAVFPVGPIQVRIDLETLKTTTVDHQHRPSIPKPGGRTVPATIFLEPSYKPISAVWAVDIDENVLIGHSCPMAVVHNPGAVNPIPEKLLPAQSEYVATDKGREYPLERRDGLLSR
jgi:hypothetical protein